MKKLTSIINQLDLLLEDLKTLNFYELSSTSYTEAYRKVISKYKKEFYNLKQENERLKLHLKYSDSQMDALHVYVKTLTQRLQTVERERLEALELLEKAKQRAKRYRVYVASLEKTTMTQQKPDQDLQQLETYNNGI